MHHSYKINKSAGLSNVYLFFFCFGYIENLIVDVTNWLTDEDDDTCNQDSSIQSVSMALDNGNIFTWLQLTFKATVPISHVSLYFNTMSSILGCQDQKIIQADHKTLQIWCSLNVAIYQVLITGEGVKSLCSVYISGGRNVALKQPTNQTSTFTDKSFNFVHGDTGQSFTAVDGNTESNFSLGSCTHTDVGDLLPTWTIRFNETFIINKFSLYNRDDKNNVRLMGFSLQALDENSSVLMNYTDKGGEPQIIYNISYFLPRPVAEVRITAYNTRNGRFLTLCEVEIFGDCPEGKKGLECKEYCVNKCPYNCNGEQACNTVCFGSSDPPKCITGCTIGMWGLNCVNNCTGRCWSSHCDSKTGLCLSGCHGYTDPPYCTQGCPHHLWGLNCSLMCSPGCVMSSCDSLTGKCQFGCSPGYIGLDCSKECPSGYWGSGCKEQCLTRCVGGNCSKITGLCLEGCMGYSDPPNCAVVCKNGLFGTNCSSYCSCNCENKNCKADDGACLKCLPGYTGKYCESEESTTEISGLSFGAILGIGIVIGISLTVIVIVLIWMFIFRRLYSRKEPGSKNEDRKTEHLYELPKQDSQYQCQQYENINNSTYEFVDSNTNNET
ncbi:hypothetical protein Btru_033548 [Bulinus truncatus]|nr:hypothetical protein Btru_033548 [Bulinus truncatus]